MSLESKQVTERIDAAAAGAKGGIDKAREGVADMQALGREIAQERAALNTEATGLQAKHGAAFAASDALSFRGASETSLAAEAGANAKTWADQGNREQAEAWTEKAKGHLTAAAEAAAKSKEVLKADGADRASERLGDIGNRTRELDAWRDKASVVERTAAKELYEGERVEAADPDAYGRHQSAKSALADADRDVKSLEGQLAKAEKELDGAEDRGDPHIASKQEHAAELRETLTDAKEARHEAKAQLAQEKLAYERVAEDNPSDVDPDPAAPTPAPATTQPANGDTPAGEPPAADQPIVLPPPLPDPSGQPAPPANQQPPATDQRPDAEQPPLGALGPQPESPGWLPGIPGPPPSQPEAPGPLPGDPGLALPIFPQDPGRSPFPGEQPGGDVTWDSSKDGGPSAPSNGDATAPGNPPVNGWDSANNSSPTGDAVNSAAPDQAPAAGGSGSRGFDATGSDTGGPQ